MSSRLRSPHFQNHEKNKQITVFPESRAPTHPTLQGRPHVQVRRPTSGAGGGVGWAPQSALVGPKFSPLFRVFFCLLVELWPPFKTMNAWACVNLLVRGHLVRESRQQFHGRPPEGEGKTEERETWCGTKNGGRGQTCLGKDGPQKKKKGIGATHQTSRCLSHCFVLCCWWMCVCCPVWFCLSRCAFGSFKKNRWGVAQSFAHRNRESPITSVVVGVAPSALRPPRRSSNDNARLGHNACQDGRPSV